MTSHPNILVIDDEKVMRDSCQQILSRTGYGVEVIEDGIKGLDMLRTGSHDVVLLDLKMPGLSGMEVLQKIQEENIQTVVIVITGYATIESAVEAMKSGAYDFLPKPFTPEELRIIVKRGLERRALMQEAAILRKEKQKLQENVVLMVSHELRSPLAVVQQYLQAIAGGFVGEVAEKQRMMIENAMERIRGMLKLINDWLNLSRMEATQLVEKFEPISLHSVVVKAIDLLRSSAETQNITLAFEGPSELSMAQGDKETLEIVFTNLIGNAIKYNTPGGKVHVKLGEDKDHIVVEVADTGVGIPKESLPFVFDQFYRVKRKEGDQVTGSGLGLAIVKQIVSAHSGTIEATSELGRGSTFTVVLPKIKGQSSNSPEDKEE